MPTPTPLGTWADAPCFYVSIADAGKFAPVAGPFRSHPAAVAALPVARRIGADTDPRSVFYAWGTVKMKNGYREGKLTEQMAAIDPKIRCGEWDYSEEHVREAARREADAVLEIAHP